MSKIHTTHMTGTHARQELANQIFWKVLCCNIYFLWRQCFGALTSHVFFNHRTQHCFYLQTVSNVGIRRTDARERVIIYYYDYCVILRYIGDDCDANIAHLSPYSRTLIGVNLIQNMSGHATKTMHPVVANELVKCRYVTSTICFFYTHTGDLDYMRYIFNIRYIGSKVWFQKQVRKDNTSRLKCHMF